MKTARFPVGLSFIYYADKQKRQRTIVDILTTTNNDGDIVKIEYVTEYTFMSQRMRECLVDSAIARSLPSDVFALFCNK